MSKCEKEERNISLTGTFEGCAEHGDFTPSGAMFSMEGIPPEEAIRLVLGTVEQTMAQFLSQNETIDAFISASYPFGDEGPEPLSDEAKAHLLGLLANQLLLRQVADRSYFVGVESALLSVPREPKDG